MSTLDDALVFANDRPTSTSDDLYQWAVDAEQMIRELHALATKDQPLADAVAEHYESQQTSIVRATVAAVMEAAGLTTLSINVERQATVWDRVELFTDRNDEQTHVTFTLTPR